VKKLCVSHVYIDCKFNESFLLSRFQFSRKSKNEYGSCNTTAADLDNILIIILVNIDTKPYTIHYSDSLVTYYTYSRATSAWILFFLTCTSNLVKSIWNLIRPRDLHWLNNSLKYNFKLSSGLVFEEKNPFYVIYNWNVTQFLSFSLFRMNTLYKFWVYRYFE